MFLSDDSRAYEEIHREAQREGRGRVRRGSQGKNCPIKWLGGDLNKVRAIRAGSQGQNILGREGKIHRGPV